MAGLKVSILGPEICEKWGFHKFLGVCISTHIGVRIFQDTLCCVAKFRENQPRDVEKSVVQKK